MRSSFFAILLARSALEGLVIALACWIAFVALGVRTPLLPAWPVASGAVITLAGAAILVRGGRARLAIGASAIAGGAAAAIVIGLGESMAQAAPRLGAGALLGAVTLWRGFSVAEAAHRWHAMAAASLAALVAIAVAAQIPFDRAGLLPVTIVAGVVAAVGLSAARGAEEILYVERHGPLHSRVGAAGALVVGIGAIAVTAASPLLRIVLGRVAELIAPYLFALVVLFVTPFVYLAEALVRAVLPLLRSMPTLRLPRLGPPALSPEQEAEYARALALQAEAFFRALAVVIVVGIVLVLVLRALSSRRLALPPGATLERENMATASLPALMRRLFGVRAERAPRPGGGDAATRVRRAYWDLLALAERSGANWRRAAQTPREHLGGLGAAWIPAATIVHAFERVRYGAGVSTRDADAVEETLRGLSRTIAEQT